MTSYDCQTKNSYGDGAIRLQQSRMGKEDAGPAAKLLASLRERAGLSMTEVGGLLGVGKSTYQHYEHGYKETGFPLSRVAAFLEIFGNKGVPRDEILRLAGPEIEIATLLPEGKRDLLEAWDALPASQHEPLLQYLRSLADAQPTPSANNDPDGTGAGRQLVAKPR